MEFNAEQFETLMEIGRKGEKEMEKLFCILLNIREKLRQEIGVNPTYDLTMALDGLQSIIDSYRAHNKEGRDLFDRLTGWTRRMESGEDPDPGGETEEEYPLDPMYHMAVAEQEKELYRLYPSRYGKE